MAATGPLFAADQPAAAGPLETVELALKPVFEKLDPKPEVTRPDGKRMLVVAYKAKMFQVNGHSIFGDITPWPRGELGPEPKGFVLRVFVTNIETPFQIQHAQSFKEPYWQIHFDKMRLAGTRKQVLWILCYGELADPDLLAQIRQTMGGLRGAKGRAGTAAEEKRL